MERPGLIRSKTNFLDSFGFGNSSRTKKDLKVLICSANAGNAEPSLNSIKAWIPEKGSIESVMQEKKYEVDMESLFKGSQYDNERYGTFDVIVIGMQEATFHTTYKMHKPANEEQEMDDDLWAKNTEETKDNMEDSKPSIPTFIGVNMNEPEESDDNSLRSNEGNIQANSEKMEHVDESNESFGSICDDLASRDSNSADNAQNFAVRKQSGFRLKKVSFRADYMQHEPSMRTINSRISYAMTFEGRKDSEEFSDVYQYNHENDLDESNHCRDICIRDYDLVNERDIELNQETQQTESKESVLKKKRSNPSLIRMLQFYLRSNTQSQNQIHKRKIFGSHYAKDSKILFDLITNRCPKYNFVVRYLHGSIRIMILVKNKLMKEVKDVRCKAVSTGVGSLLKNKVSM